MYFQYGGYRHEAGEVLLSSVTRSVERSPRGDPILAKLSFQIQGELLGDSQYQLTQKLDALEDAYARQDQTAGLFHDNGARTVHYMPASGTLGGVRSSGVSYPEGSGIEYATKRRYTVTLEADYPFDGGLLEFTESLSFTGTCEERWIYLSTLNGPPERQTVGKVTTQKVTQSGSAVGYFARPSPPPPLWPANEHKENRQITIPSPKVIRGRLMDYGVQWSYSFESATPLVGQPRTQ